jgi:hypothetical protein
MNIELPRPPFRHQGAGGAEPAPRKLQQRDGDASAYGKQVLQREGMVVRPMHCLNTL